MLFFLKTLFWRGSENCSETFSGSANDPPPSLPPHLHVFGAVDPTLGDAGTYLKFPRSRLPHMALVEVSQTAAST